MTKEQEIAMERFFNLMAELIIKYADQINWDDFSDVDMPE